MSAPPPGGFSCLKGTDHGFQGALRCLSVSASNPAVSLRAVTRHDTDEIEFVSNGLLIGAGGTIAVLARDDTDPVTLTVVAEPLLPVRARKVLATSTTATGIVALISRGADARASIRDLSFLSTPSRPSFQPLVLGSTSDPRRRYRKPRSRHLN